MRDRNWLGRIVWTFNWICFLCLICGLGGCAVLNPGGQVKEGLTQATLYGWNEKEFTADIKGTQEGEFTMAEGDIILNDDGTVNFEESTISAYLHSKPSAQPAVDASAVFAEMGARQTESLERSFANALDLIREAMSAGLFSAGPEEPAPVVPPGP